MTASATLVRPPGTEVTAPEETGEQWVIMRPNGSMVRLGHDMGRLLDLVDGRTDAAGLAERLGAPWDTAHVDAALTALEANGLLHEPHPEVEESPATGWRATLARWQSATTPDPATGYILERGRLRIPNLNAVQFTVFDAPRLMDGTSPWGRRFANRATLIGSLLLGGLGLLMVLVQMDRLMQAVATPQPAWNYLALLAGMVLAVSLHEFAHGITLARFGGRVRRIGVMLFYLSPAFFVDVTDGWRLRDPKQRCMVALAGGIGSVAIAGIVSAVWTLSPGAPAFLAALVVGLYIGSAINLAPFVKFDGYIALMTWTDTPFLRQKAMISWKAAVVRLLQLRRPFESRGDLVLGLFGIGCSLFPIYLMVTVAENLGGASSGLGVAGTLIRSGIYALLLVLLTRGLTEIVVIAGKVAQERPAGRWAEQFEAQVGRSPLQAAVATAGAVAVTTVLTSVPIATYATTPYLTEPDGSVRMIVGEEDVIPAGTPITLSSVGLFTSQPHATAMVAGETTREDVPVTALNPGAVMPLPGVTEVSTAPVGDIVDRPNPYGIDRGPSGVATVQTDAQALGPWLVDAILTKPLEQLGSLL